MTTVLNAIGEALSGLGLLMVLLIGVVIGMLILHKMSQGDLSMVIRRVKRVKMPAFEVELFESLDQLETTAEKAAEEVASSGVVHALSGAAKGTSNISGKLAVTTHSRTLPQAAVISVDDEASIRSTESIAVSRINSEDDIVNTVLDQAVADPKIALIRLSIELERELQRLLGSMGLLGDGHRYLPVRQAIEMLNKRHSLLPDSVVNAMDNFWQVRNLIVHGGDGSRDEVLRAIDSGLVVFMTLRSVPRVTHVVYYPAADVYTDSEGQEVRSNVKSVILEEVSRGGVLRTKHVLPTTRTDYEKGMQVTWEFNDKVRWGESWYRDPDTQKIQYGWRDALEFVGRDIGSRSATST